MQIILLTINSGLVKSLLIPLVPFLFPDLQYPEAITARATIFPLSLFVPAPVDSVPEFPQILFDHLRLEVNGVLWITENTTGRLIGQAPAAWGQDEREALAVK